MKRLCLIILTLIIIGSIFTFNEAFSMSATKSKAAPPDAPSLEKIMKKEFDGRDLKRTKVLDDNKYYTRYYITYLSGPYKISGIMNVPKGKGPFPVIILGHGYINTRYYTNGRGLKREQDYLAKKGYVVLHTDYRNHAQSDKDPDNNMNMRMGYVEDVINAAEAVKNAPYDFVDKENIGMLGHSLGGGIGLNIMVAKPGLFKAYVLLAPISADSRKNFERWIAKGRPEVAEALRKKFGDPKEIREKYGTPVDNPSFWYNISPQNYLKNIKDPVMVHHGTKDDSVPIEWSEELYESFKENGRELIYYSYYGEPHEFIQAWPLVMKRTADFFDDHLK